MSEPVAYRFKSPLSEEGQWEYGKEPPVGSRWEIEGLYRVQVNVPRTPLEKAAKDVLQLVDYMLRNGEWYQAQERADALRAALAQPDQRKALEQQEPVAYTGDVARRMREAGMTFHLGMPHAVVMEQMTRFHDIVCAEASIKAAAAFAHPPRREWQSLSEEEIQSIHDTYHKRMGPQEFARAVEAALKEKNA